MSIMEDLLAQVERLTAEVEELKAERRADEDEAPFSRRHLLAKLGAAAVGASAAATIASTEPAAAATGGALILGTSNTANVATELKWNGASGYNGVLLLANDSPYGITGALYPAALGGWAAGTTAGVANGIFGYTEVAGGNAVVGVATGGADNTGIRGSSDAGNGVVGITTAGAGKAGVRAESATAADGVFGKSTSTGVAIRAESTGAGAAVDAHSNSSIGVDASSGGSGPLAFALRATTESFGVTTVMATATGGSSTALVAAAEGSFGLGMQASGAVGGVYAFTSGNSTDAFSTAGDFVAYNQGWGVRARVMSATNSRPAVHGQNSGTGAGVHGQVSLASSVANGVLGETNRLGSGVRGDITNSSSPAAAVFGVTAGSGSGVSGKVVVATSAGAGVFGATDGTGTSVRGRTTNTSNTAACGRFNHDGGGPGVHGTSATGIGVTAQGGAAPLRLVPTAAAGAPTSGSHQVGEIVVDVAGELSLCTAGGTPGTRKKVTLT